MDARTIRLRLSGHGDVRRHRDGSFTLRLVRPADEGYDTQALWRVVSREIPGATLTLWRSRRAADRYFEVHEVFFRIGDAPQRALTATSAQSSQLAAGTSAETVRGAGVHASVCRGDVTAGRDRHFDLALGTRPEFIHSVTAQLLDTEGPNHEVATAEGAVIPARNCEPPEKRPGSTEGPGRVSPGALVGLEQGRAA